MTAHTISPVAFPAVGTYCIDPERSSVRYAGRHMFGLGVVHATFRINSGEIQIADPPTASTVTISIDANSFASGNAKRDKVVRSATLLDTATYPDIAFNSSNLRWDGDHWLLGGPVTAHGVTADVELKFDRVVQEPLGIRVQARAEHLDRHAFGVKGSRGWVGRHLDLDFDIYAAL
ncbi:MAG TPA: YceI family protein [Nakamurella sp.]